jgi:hypothetical protein
MGVVGLGFAALLVACAARYGGQNRPSPPMPKTAARTQPSKVEGMEEKARDEASAAESDASSPVPEMKRERRPGAWANVDPSDDDVEGPPDAIEDCAGTLERAGVTFRPATIAVHEIRTKRAKIVCGAPQVVTYLKGPGKIAYDSAPVVTCAMAAALASFEKLVQEEANAGFGSPVVRIEHLGTFNCREMAAYPGFVSEHSYANAIDIARFVLKNGRIVDVQRDFDLGLDEPKKAGGRFLRLLSQRAHDEDVFSHVLTPFWDAHHRNHFHLDLSRYRSDGTRPRRGPHES